MKVIILTCNSEIESAKKLGYTDTLDFLSGNVEKYNTQLIVRWGNGMEYNNQFGSPVEFQNVITKCKSIELNCNKPKALKKLSEVVLTPRLWTKAVPKRKLAVFRPTAHAAGKDFQVKKGPFQVDSYHYATEFVRSDKEIRVWYCNGKTMCARRVTKNQKRLDEKFKCRSLWSYNIWKKTPIRLHKQVLKAAKHLGFEYGAFDIIIGKNNKYYFLENNTAPSLDHSRIIKFYQRGLKSIINKKIKQIEKEWKKNPPLEIQFKVVAFNMEKPEDKPQKIGFVNNTNVIPNRPYRPGFLSRILGNWNIDITNPVLNGAT